MKAPTDTEAAEAIMDMRMQGRLDEGRYLWLLEYIREVRALRDELHYQNEQHMFYRDELRKTQRQCEDLFRRLDQCMERRHS